MSSLSISLLESPQKITPISSSELGHVSTPEIKGRPNENLVFLDLYRRCQRERGIKNTFMLPISSVCHISQQSFDSYLVNEITTSLKFKNSKHSLCLQYLLPSLPTKIIRLFNTIPNATLLLLN